MTYLYSDDVAFLRVGPCSFFLQTLLEFIFCLIFQHTMADWKHGLFGCFDNFGLCLKTYCCPCVVFGKIAETVGDNCFLCGLSMFVPIVNFATQVIVRGKVRAAKGIEGTTGHDVLMTLCCGFCSVVQMAQETEGDPPAAASMSRE